MENSNAAALVFKKAKKAQTKAETSLLLQKFERKKFEK